MASAVAIGLALLAGPAFADYSAGKAYYDSGRYNEAAREFSVAAEGGHALAQYMMGRLHQEGRGADRDLVQAYMWYSLAAQNGYYPAVAARDTIGQAMSSAQRAQAQQMASDWQLSHGRYTTTTSTTTQPVPRATTTYSGSSAAYAEPYSIRAVQRVLNELGYPAGPVDGVMGQKTRSAIRAFQIDAGLPVSGEPSRSLYESLLAAREDQTAPVVVQPQPQPQPLPQPIPQPQPTYDTQMVVDLQTELRKRGYDVPTISGKLDTATTVAIREYQADAGMVVDGRPSFTLLANLRASSTATQPTSIAYREQVRQVQALLNARGYDAGPADGVMGPKTRDAIRTYQADSGLPVSGDVSTMLISQLQTGSGTGTGYPVGGYPQQPVDNADYNIPTSERDLIIAIERELDNLGYDVADDDDGVFQRKSREALRDFLKDAGLAVTSDPTPTVLEQIRSGRVAPGSKLDARYRQIEQRLAQKGYAVGAVDGILDAQARAAIRDYQRDAGLPVTGVGSAALLNHLTNSTITARTSGGIGTGTSAGSNIVYELERELQLRRYSVGPVDGVIDLRTQFGIESYQRQAGLPVTGEATGALLAHMRANPQITALSYGTPSLTSGPFELVQ